MCLKLLMLGEITEIVNGSIRSVNCQNFSVAPKIRCSVSNRELDRVISKALVVSALTEMQLERSLGRTSCRNNMLLRCIPPKWPDRGS
jgi:hypothetical protein